LKAERRRLLKLITAGIGALAVAIGLSGAGSLIKQLLYGEKAVEISSSFVKYKARDGVEIAAHLCRPNGRGPFPAVIVIHEVFGLVDHIRDIACRFARAGYVGIAPDLFSREGGPGEMPDVAAIMKVIENLPDRRVLADLDAAVDYLKSLDFVRGDRIGVIGFCMGGAYSLLFAGHSKELAAAVVFYGRIFYPKITENKPTSPIELVPSVRSPILGIFGEADRGIPVSDVRKLEERLKAEGKTFEIKIYPDAPHAFFNDTRPSYRPEAARDAWERTLRFFKRYLS